MAPGESHDGVAVRLARGQAAVISAISVAGAFVGLSRDDGR
jgi:hypothetical protein